MGSPEAANVHSGSDAGVRIVVVGNGMVGHRFCELLREQPDAQRFRVTVFGEEHHPAYDRVHLSECFSGRDPKDLQMADPEWYREQQIELHLGDPVEFIDRDARVVKSKSGRSVEYDHLVLATGSSAAVPPIGGVEKRGVFVYRTIDDLERLKNWGSGKALCRSAVVIGGGLLGLEAAKACHDMGLETHVVEFAPRLMPRQVDSRGGALLRNAIESLGVHVWVGARTRAILGPDVVTAVQLDDGIEIEAQMVVISAGIVPRDELARASGLAVGDRGGILVDDTLATSDPRISVIGEAALHGGMIYGLVAPGYQMAEVVARRLCGETASFPGADMSTQLKLMGVDVASLGEPFADELESKSAQSLVFEDPITGVYQKLVISEDGSQLLGAVLVGDASPFGRLMGTIKSGKPIPARPQELLFGAASAAGAEGEDDDEMVCSCNNVTCGDIRTAIREQELVSVGGIKACTRAGTGCGGCVPTVARLLDRELAKAGRAVERNVCEHFPVSRPELFQMIKIRRVESFEQALAECGAGNGCEICRPVVASILASTWNDLVQNHSTIQDTNDRFLANIQRGGTYSVIPRVPGGEITPEKLIVLGRVAAKYDLYCKITGGQRIDLLGARVGQLPEIWEELVEAGFESGHAYGKAMRTVKSCIGSTWCRYGVQDSTAFAIRVEERYRGIRAPHKLKSAVSGCIRECAEAQNKDFGIIATEKGWNLYLCGNGGSNPRHGDLFATDLDDETCLRYIDRFLMYYIYTANPLERTARWIERLDGGIDYLRRVVIEDSLGICEQLDRDMGHLVDTYQCEWAAATRDPMQRARFRHFVNSELGDENVRFVRERSQKRPANWPDVTPLPLISESETQGGRAPEEPVQWNWRRVAAVRDFPRDGGCAVQVGRAQLAVYHFASRGEWYAAQNLCPHRKDMVLSRGLLGDQSGEPKVACPLHKKTFSLHSGKGLSDPDYAIRTFEVEVRGEDVYLKLPPTDVLEQLLGCHGAAQRGAA